MGRPWSAAGSAPGSAPTLAERTAAERTASARDERAALTSHCWVLDAPGSTGRSPGLLLEWRREGRVWLGLVAYVQREESERFRLVQRWLPAEVLAPVDSG